jgi:hypothetical protein
VLSLNTPSAPFATAWTNVIFNRQNGTTNRLFEIKASKLKYEFHAEINHEMVNNGFVNHFLAGIPAVKMYVDARLPFWLDPTSEYASADTINANLDSLLNTDNISINLDEVTVDISYKNHLPVQVIATAIFVDENDYELYRKDNVVIECPNVDANGLVTAEKVSTLQIGLASQESETITNTKKIIMQYRIAGQNATSQINVRGTDYLDVVVSLFVKGRINANLDSLFNNK